MKEKLDYDIVAMAGFITAYGEAAFRSAIFHGAFSEHSMAFIHPDDSLRGIAYFKEIQEAFIAAYV